MSLKSLVKEHWQPDEVEEDETFDKYHQAQQSNYKVENKTPKKQISKEEKNMIKQALPSGLADSHSQLRTAIAMVIASIAQWDWPNEWPNLIQDLSKCLQSQNQELLQVDKFKFLEKANQIFKISACL